MQAKGWWRRNHLFMQTKGWWRRNRLSDRWEKLGLSERMPVKNHYHNGNDVHSALGAWW